MKLHSRWLVLPVLAALAVVLGGFAAPNVAQAGMPPAAVCGNNVLEMGEQCDGTADAACPGLCQVNCTCPTLQQRVTALEALTASMSLQSGGTILRFTGVNVQVVDGSGTTAGVTNGSGNLIVGYNEDVGANATRTGSHNLVVGPEHSFSSFGGFVAGLENTISGDSSSVSGGLQNTASGPRSSVSGGFLNVASGIVSSVSGGQSNTASGNDSSVLGGFLNQASSSQSSVCGGQANTASGASSSVSGGVGNVASEVQSSVSGGGCNIAGPGPAQTCSFGGNGVSSVSGGVNNLASGKGSSVSGGNTRSATGTDNWAAGSLFELN